MVTYPDSGAGGTGRVTDAAAAVSDHTSNVESTLLIAAQKQAVLEQVTDSPLTGTVGTVVHLAEMELHSTSESDDRIAQITELVPRDPSSISEYVPVMADGRNVDDMAMAPVADSVANIAEEGYTEANPTATRTDQLLTTLGATAPHGAAFAA